MLNARQHISSLLTRRTSCSFQSASYMQTAYKLKKHAAKDHANDGSGAHPHQANVYCVRSNCDEQVCAQLCDLPKDYDFRGHNTHKPPIGRFVRFISDVDANGNPSKQYFVPSNKPNSMTEQERQAYGNDIKADTKTENYIKKNSDKYE